MALTNQFISNLGMEETQKVSTSLPFGLKLFKYTWRIKHKRHFTKMNAIL